MFVQHGYDIGGHCLLSFVRIGIFAEVVRVLVSGAWHLPSIRIAKLHHHNLLVGIVALQHLYGAFEFGNGAVEIRIVAQADDVIVYVGSLHLLIEVA